MSALQEPLGPVLARAPASWRPLVLPWLASSAGQALVRAVDARRAAGAMVYPGEVLRALESTPFDAVRVVILGQDPYHGQGQAEGLAFSVPAGLRVPPSLRNIQAELERDLGLPPPGHGHLGGWARQGVLLLNTTLTVEEAAPGSHAGLGWEALTGAVIQALAAHESPKVFLLWGAHAQRCVAAAGHAMHRAHACFASNHPSPLSARRGPVPFVGNGHFRAANRHLQQAGRPAIDWSDLPV